MHTQILVIGGGINGAGIARQAAVSGYSCLLVEKGDFANATSSQSSKLIHGGIRYLEGGHFSLVREALHERAVLLEVAPHLVKPLQLHIPVYRQDKRSYYTVRLGVKAYDVIAGRANLTPSRGLSGAEIQALEPLKKEDLKGVISYWDAQVFDSRLVLEVILTAKKEGAKVRNYTEAVDFTPVEKGYRVLLKDHRSGRHQEVTCNVLINASGPWASQLDQRITGDATRPRLTHVRGVHLLTKLKTDKAYLMTPPDGRVVFHLPWMGFSLIGTTETAFEGDDFSQIPASQEEVDYLKEVFAAYFPSLKIADSEILHCYAGVRSLVGQGKLHDLSREYKIQADRLFPGKGYLAVFGGKLTTFRSLALKVIGQVQRVLEPLSQSKMPTEYSPLVGGLTQTPTMQKRWEDNCREAKLSNDTIARWQRLYGFGWIKIAERALADPEMRKQLAGTELFLAELCHMIAEEMAWELDDILFRRSLLGVKINHLQKDKLAEALWEWRNKLTLADEEPGKEYN